MNNHSRLQFLCALDEVFESSHSYDEVHDRLLGLAQLQIAQGVLQSELYSAFMAKLVTLQASGPSEPFLAATEDVMDLVSGWCTPDRRLYK